jgi:hypothetical protein
MKPLLLLFVLAGTLDARSAFADPVWDPTEIARLSEQAAQLGTNLSTLIDNLQTFDKLATEVGATGTRPLTAFQPSSTLLAKINLQSSSMPASSDALALISITPTTESQTQSSWKIWSSAYQTVAIEGLSLAHVANQDLSSAKTRSQALGIAASNAQDLRGDVQANSAVCLAVLAELGSVQAVLALLLEQQSLARLTSTH